MNMLKGDNTWGSLGVSLNKCFIIGYMIPDKTIGIATGTSIVQEILLNLKDLHSTSETVVIMQTKQHLKKDVGKYSTRNDDQKKKKFYASCVVDMYMTH